MGQRIPYWTFPKFNWNCDIRWKMRTLFCRGAHCEYSNMRMFILISTFICKSGAITGQRHEKKTRYVLVHVLSMGNLVQNIIGLESIRNANVMRLFVSHMKFCFWEFRMNSFCILDISSQINSILCTSFSAHLITMWMLNVQQAFNNHHQLQRDIPTSTFSMLLPVQWHSKAFCLVSLSNGISVSLSVSFFHFN